ncbi:hypothetical protein PPACK8108_LOCUS26098 [Phakopsora pachyrhizi]|uniref:Sorting nexin MVP1 n=1 Tax=Phakopsora pachyrhizi TaxID=170000 RepID=A0AAV0BYM2_PHAPC|nr:hypothetical protein PPACK8108_LOCUS26098 [Phakopsora pachyrhizi]
MSSTEINNRSSTSKLAYSPGDFTSPLTASLPALGTNTGGLIGSSRPVSTVSLSNSTSDIYPTDPWLPRLGNGGAIDDLNFTFRLDGAINEASLPLIYHQAFGAADPNGATASIANVHRVLASSGVGASVIEQILSASCGRSSRVSKSEFSIALAAVAYAQQGKSPFNVQRAISRKSSFPVPSLDLAPSLLNSLNRSHSRRSSLPDDPWCPTPTATLKTRHGQSNSISNTNFFVEESENPVSPTKIRSGPSESGTKNSNLCPLPYHGLSKADHVSIKLSSPEGWILKYNVYSVEHETKGTSVPRRFSGRHLVTGDEGQFIERRRRGLQRFLTYLINHPIISKDSVLNIFLSEPSDLSTWRSHSTVHLPEESTTSRLTAVEEISIPEDLDDQLINFRSRLPLIIEHWSRICASLDRIVRRNEAQSSDFTRIQLALGSAVESERAGLSGDNQLHGRIPEIRRSEEEIETISHHIGKYSTIIEQRSSKLALSTNEQVRAHRDLFTDFIYLFVRYDRLSGDDVDQKLKPRAENNSKKLEEIRNSKRVGWQDESDRLKNLIEQDRAAIESKLKRRVFIRWCLWQELVYVLRAGTLVSKVWREFVEDERKCVELTLSNWTEMDESIDNLIQLT